MYIYPLSALFGGVGCLLVLFVCFFFPLIILILHCLLLQTFRRPQFRVKDGKRVSRSVRLLACFFVRLIADFVSILCLIFVFTCFLAAFILALGFGWSRWVGRVRSVAFSLGWSRSVGHVWFGLVALLYLFACCTCVLLYLRYLLCVRVAIFICCACVLLYLFSVCVCCCIFLL